MKTIRILIPTYNEQDNVEPLAAEIAKHFEKELPKYNYYINFIDNKSQDNTRQVIRKMAKSNPRIKAIFNAKNFGQFNSPFYGLVAAGLPPSDCTITMCADFQDPVSNIAKYVKEWETGAQVVAGVKAKSKESFIMRFLRTRYYKFIRKVSTVKHIEHFTGSALYDQSFIDILRDIKDPIPFMRGMVPEFCGNIATIEYTQEKRRAGKTSNNWKTLYDGAMLSFTTYTKRFPRYATIWGFLLTGLSVLALVGLGVCRIFFEFEPWYFLFAGLSMFSFINLFFIGILGEYIVNMNLRLLNRPLVIEEERVNVNN